jgi:vitamin K-dependent gamma-carboxylase
VGGTLCGALDDRLFYGNDGAGALHYGGVSVPLGYAAVCAGLTYIFLLEKTNYLNHAYLFCWLCFVMIFLPAHRAFSVDVWRKPALHRNTIPFWSMAILPALMGIVYFYGGLAKLNSDWLQAMPLKLWMSYKDDLPVIGPLLATEATAYFMAYGGLLLDLFVVFFLLNKRTRVWAFAATLFFHFMNHLVFTIGIFPFLSTALTAMYFPPTWPRQLLDRLGTRLGVVRRWQERWQARIATAPQPVPLWQEMPGFQSAIQWMLIAVIGFHLLLPFRHHLYPGNAAWTEEGHRYSWRMMLRSKSGIGYFLVRFKDGSEEEIEAKDWLSNRQRRKMLTHPDMILQFAHHLRDHYKAKGEEVEVYAHIRVKLNGRRRQYLIDREVDLAKVEWSFFKPSDWIVPLTVPLYEE